MIRGRSSLLPARRRRATTACGSWIDMMTRSAVRKHNLYFRRIRRERRDTSGWHYVNIAHDAQGFNRERDGHKGGNVIDAIEREAKVLADTVQPREKRVEALKFVVHFIGDLHQPLHCADGNGDRGGNARLVFFLDRRRADSLHYVWDTALVREIIQRRPIAQVADAVSKTIAAKQRQEWAEGTPTAWANESHRLAVEKVYADVPADGPPLKLTRADVAKATPVVTQQVKRAGAARDGAECGVEMTAAPFLSRDSSQMITQTVRVGTQEVVIAPREAEDESFVASVRGGRHGEHAFEPADWTDPRVRLDAARTICESFASKK